MLKVKVSQMESPRSGNPVANQFEIFTDEGVYFQSYSTVIAFKNKEGKIFLDQDSWNYSVTTSKYRNEFLREDTKETKRKIASGEYTLIDLN